MILFLYRAKRNIHFWIIFNFLYILSKLKCLYCQIEVTALTAAKENANGHRVAAYNVRHALCQHRILVRYLLLLFVFK